MIMENFKNKIYFFKFSYSVSVFMPYIAKHMEKFVKSCYPKDLEGYFIDLLKEAIQARQDNPTVC